MPVSTSKYLPHLVTLNNIHASVLLDSKKIYSDDQSMNIASNISARMFVGKDTISRMGKAKSYRPDHIFSRVSSINVNKKKLNIKDNLTKKQGGLKRINLVGTSDNSSTRDTFIAASIVATMLAALIITMICLREKK